MSGKPAPSLKAVFALGNPGPQYEHSRHNVGFRIADMVADCDSALWEPQTRRRVLSSSGSAEVLVRYSRVLANGTRYLLAKPLTFMNRSGSAVEAIVRGESLGPDEWMVISDDVHLPLGRIRFRKTGTSGGQKGLQDIIDTLKTEDFARLRFGIGSPGSGEDLSEYVLGLFDPHERDVLEEALAKAAEAVCFWFDHGTASAMNHFNE